MTTATSGSSRRHFLMTSGTMMILGHKSLAMSARYSHLSPAHQRQALERLATREPEVGLQGWN